MNIVKTEMLFYSTSSSLNMNEMLDAVGIFGFYDLIKNITNQSYIQDRLLFLWFAHNLIA